MFNNGLFSVSAGANIINDIPDIIDIKYKIKSGNTMYLINNGIPTNINNDETQHIHDLEACIPKPVVLNTLNNSSNKIVSLNIPRINDNNSITIILVIVKYMASNPYLISASLVSV